MTGPRKRPVDPDRLPPCRTCGLRYVDFRGVPGGPGFAGRLASHKAGAWADHLEHCEDYSADALAFDVEAFDVDRPRVRTLYTPPPPPPDEDDPFSDDVDPVAVCLQVAWEAREALARRILGADWSRVTEAA